MAHSQRNVVLLFTARSIRLFAYGALSVVLALYLHEAGLSSADIGLLFTLTLAGDAGITLWITTTADRFGRKKMLLLGAGLMVMAGVVFSLTGNIVLLMIAGIIGVISPSGNEIGPFLSLEQAALSQLLTSEQRTRAFGWYNLAGSLSAAAGALGGGFLSQAFMNTGQSAYDAYRAVILGYAACGIILMVVFLFLSSEVEAIATVPAQERVLGLHKSKRVVLKLSALFALDAFAGGFVIQSMVAYWFHIRFGLDAGVLGSIFFGANILAGVSALLAVPDREPDRTDQHHGLSPTSRRTSCSAWCRSCRTWGLPSPCCCSVSASRRWTFPRASPTPWRSLLLTNGPPLQASRPSRARWGRRPRRFWPASFWPPRPC